MPVLDNPTHEAFARAIVVGKSRSEAYRIASGKNGSGAAEIGKKWFRRVEVGLRIAELTALKNAATEKVEAKTAAVLAEKFAGQLLDMNERRGLLAARARGEQVRDGDLVAILLADARLAGELVEKVESSIDDKRTLTAEQAAQRLAQVQAERLLRVLPKSA